MIGYYKSRLFVLLFLLLSIGSIFLISHLVWAATPSPATLNATATDPQSQQSTKAAGAPTVIPNDLPSPKVELIEFISTGETKTISRLFPGGIAKFSIQLSNKNSLIPIKNLKAYLSFPDYATVAGPIDGQIFADQHQILWEESEIPIGQTLTKQVSFNIPKEISLDIITFDLKALVKASDRPRQKTITVKIDIWGKVIGQLIARDENIAKKDQPIAGVQIELLANDKKLSDQDQSMVVSDKDGRYQYVIKRADTYRQEGANAPSLKLKIIFATPDTDDYQGLGMKFYRTDKSIENYGLDPSKVELQPVILMTTDFPIHSSETTKQDILLSPLIQDMDLIKLAEPQGPQQQGLVRVAGTIWKNIWEATKIAHALISNDENSSLWTKEKPIRIYFHTGDETVSVAPNDDIFLGNKRWKLLPSRGSGGELHELMHLLAYKNKKMNFPNNSKDLKMTQSYLNLLQSRPQGLIKIPETNPFSKLMEDPIDNNWLDWLNDFSADSFSEGLAEFGSMWFDHAINGIRNASCDWCLLDDGGEVLADDKILYATMALFSPTTSRPYLINANKPVSFVKGSKEVGAVMYFLKSMIVGVDHALVGLRSSSQLAPPWARRISSDQSDIELLNNGEVSLEVSQLRFKQFLHGVELLKTGSGQFEQTTISDMFNYFIDNPDTKNLAPGAAIAYGLFTDTNCNYHWDPHEEIGKPAHWWGAYILEESRFSTIKDALNVTYGARPWRKLTRPYLKQSIELELVDEAKQPIVNPISLTVRTDFAPPFGDLSSEYQIKTLGGRITLMLPPAIYRSRALITIGDTSKPSLIIDSEDYWAILNRPITPSVVAKATINVNDPLTITVPAWPDNIVVPAAQTPLDFISASVDQPKEQPLIQPQPAPVDQKLTVNINNTVPTLQTTPTVDQEQEITTVLKPTAGKPLHLSITGFSAPQTLTIELDGVAIDETRLISHDGEIAFIIPEDTPRGGHALKVIGQVGEEVSLPIKIEAAATTLPPSTWRDGLMLLLALMGLILVIRLRYRLIGMLVISAGSMIMSTNIMSTNIASAQINGYIRNPDFIQFIPADSDNPDNTITGLWRMNDWNGYDNFNNQPERLGYWGRPETICFVQRLADNWNKIYPDEILTVNDMSLPDGGVYKPHVTHRTGHSIDLWSEKRALPRYQFKIRASGDQWNENDSYNPKMAEDFLFAIGYSWLEVSGQIRNLPKALFNPKPGYPLPQLTIPGTRKRKYSAERNLENSNHWHIELPNPRGQYFVE